VALVYALNVLPDLIAPRLVLQLQQERVLLEHIRQQEHRHAPRVRSEPFHQRVALVYALNVLPDLIAPRLVLQLQLERVLLEHIPQLVLPLV